MHIYDTQSSKITLSNIGSLNALVAITKAEINPPVGQSFETVEFSNMPEINSKVEPWKYSINQYGYRGATWDFKKSPAVFGDSTVLGVGVQTPAAEILQQKYNDKVIPNLGIPSGSVINIVKSFAAFAHLHPMSHAFITLPSIDRFYYLSHQKHHIQRFSNLLPTWPNSRIDDHTRDQFFKVWTDGPNISYALDYIDWAQQIALAYDIKVYWTTWDSTQTAPLLRHAVGDKFFKYPHIDSADARDKLHPGIQSHRALADMYWDIIQQS